MTSRPSDYSIGSDNLPGLGKLVEECGELTQVAGKILGLGHAGAHWDGTVLADKLIEEIGDVAAAIDFFVQENLSDDERLEVLNRREAKIELFERWHHGT